MNPQRPSGFPPRPPTPGLPNPKAQLYARMKQQFGAMGSLSGVGADPIEEDPVDERAILADDFLASLFAFFGASPTFDAPGIWSNSFRFDTALVLVWGPLLVWSMWKLKINRAMRIYLVLALFIEPFSEIMLRQQNEGYWDSVLWPASVAFYGTIKEWSGMPGASMPVFFFLTLGLLYRAVWGKKPVDFVAPPRFAKQLLFLFLGTIALLSIYGLAHGGRVEGTFRQITHLMQVPLIGFLFLYVLRVPEDLAAIGSIYVVTALMRSALVAYVYFVVCMPQGITDRPGLPEWCTTHSDSVLFVIAILVMVTHAFEQRTKRAIYRAIGVSVVLLFAIALNNRRLAYVSLMMAPFAIYLALKPSKRKRRLTAALIIGIPAVILYVLIGSEINSLSPLVKPAKLVMSVLDQKDLSALSRDVENENLIYTLRQSPVLSTGFGFEYQYSPNNPPVDLSEVFVNFRLIAHNGVLWIWSLGGVVGFTLLWLIFPISATLALRGYRGARSAIERSSALTAFGAVAICVVQVWGDQGLNGYMVPVTLGVAFSVATRLAMRS